MRNRIFVIDGNVTTSAGVTAGIDLALHVIAEHAGPVVATASRGRSWSICGAPITKISCRRGSHIATTCLRSCIARRTRSSPIRRLDWTLASIADAAHTSFRHLSRLFREETGTTALGYLRQIRVAIARERLATTDASIERVAEDAGFHSAHHLRRAWRRQEDGSPRVGRSARGIDPS